jgi:hypothetical protein
MILACFTAKIPKFPLLATFCAAEKPKSQANCVVVETITMTTVTEHRIIRTAEDANADQPPPKPPKAVTLQPPALPEGRSVYVSSQSVENMKNDLNATVIPKFNVNGTAQAITGILKGGKLRKTDSVQVSVVIGQQCTAHIRLSP